MDNSKLIYTIGGLAAGSLLTFLILNNTIQPQFFGMMGRGVAITQTPQKANLIDAHFIEQMIPHHEDAITMSRLALQKSQRQEVKTLAQNIIDSQSKEIEQMKGWYKDWFGRQLPRGDEVMEIHGMMGRGPMHMGMMGDETDLDALVNASDFDKEFLSQMIPHHQMAVMMASMLKNGTDRPQMKQLADGIITAQTKEIDQMRDWLKSWKQL